MLIYDFKCDSCGKQVEELVESCNVKHTTCADCGGTTSRQFPAPNWKWAKISATGSSIDAWAKKRKSHMAWERRYLEQGQGGQ